MPIKQAWNNRIKAWVKYELSKNGFKVIDVKEKEPWKPFKGIKIGGNKR